MKTHMILAILSGAWLLSCTSPDAATLRNPGPLVTSKDYESCSASSAVQDVCAISPDEVHPTQFALGFKDMEKKRPKIAKIKNDPKKLHKYLEGIIAPAVKGPGNVFYIVDGHHKTRALSEESVREMYIRVTDDRSALSLGDFWISMKQSGLVWLYDENGDGPKRPEEIPDSIKALPDDLYRSLADDVKNEGAYEEVAVPYLQFYWANFFRSRISIDRVRDDYETAVRDAVKLARSPEAMDLPGYIK